jgi:hypothetical protein
MAVDDPGHPAKRRRQAGQWFNRPVFYAEVDRVLAAGGVVALIQNNRPWPLCAARRL